MSSPPRCCRATEISRAVSSGNQDEFPGIPASGRGVRVGGQPRHRHHHRGAGPGQGRRAVYLKDIWPSAADVARAVSASVDSRNVQEKATPMCSRATQIGTASRRRRQDLRMGRQVDYVKNPPYFDGMTMSPAAVGDIKGAARAAVLGDSVTTDHISRPGTFPSPARRLNISSRRVCSPRISILRRPPRQS